MTTTPEAVAELAAELERIEDQYGPGEKALALIARAMEGYSEDVNVAAMLLRRPWTGGSR